MVNHELIRIGDLSRLTGVAIATLRYYESEGLIQCVRTRTKYRMFSRDTVATVRRIVHLKSLKIPLGEIRRIFNTQLGGKQHVLELQRRLQQILEHKSLWEEEERKVRLILESLPQAEGEPS